MSKTFCQYKEANVVWIILYPGTAQVASIYLHQRLFTIIVRAILSFYHYINRVIGTTQCARAFLLFMTFVYLHKDKMHKRKPYDMIN